MRRSASIAAASLAGCMRASHAMVHEHSMAAQFEYGCKAAGAQRMAYPPVVAGGADACTIHYSRNDKVGGRAGLAATPARSAQIPNYLLANSMWLTWSLCITAASSHGYCSIRWQTLNLTVRCCPSGCLQHVPGTDLLLLDGGCEFHGYCSDVTRTWPVGGQYSGAQRAVYDIVLDCHR